MRKSFFALMAVVCCTILFTACNDYETYGEKKDKERDAISSFIADSSIVVISESDFHAKGDVTDTARNEFVYLEDNGIYMQIVHKGYGQPLQDGERATLLMRYLEVCIMDDNHIYNDTSPYDPDEMIVERSGNTYTATFSTKSLMYQTYGSASVPTGLIAPLPYINVGNETDGVGHIAQIRLIVPHSKGHTLASSYVYPYYYEISLQRSH